MSVTVLVSPPCTSSPILNNPIPRIYLTSCYKNRKYLEIIFWHIDSIRSLQLKNNTTSIQLQLTTNKNLYKNKNYIYAKASITMINQLLKKNTSKFDKGKHCICEPFLHFEGKHDVEVVRDLASFQSKQLMTIEANLNRITVLSCCRPSENQWKCSKMCVCVCGHRKFYAIPAQLPVERFESI